MRLMGLISSAYTSDGFPRVYWLDPTNGLGVFNQAGAAVGGAEVSTKATCRIVRVNRAKKNVIE
jgi:hypothetical protein